MPSISAGQATALRYCYYYYQSQQVTINKSNNRVISVGKRMFWGWVFGEGFDFAQI